jgi:hypothetical protein
VISVDANGNPTYGSDNTFTTTATPVAAVATVSNGGGGFLLPNVGVGISDPPKTSSGSPSSVIVLKLKDAIESLKILILKLRVELETKTNLPDSQTPEIQNFSFEENMVLGKISTDVSALQKFLNSRGFVVAQSGPGSVGRETNFFGYATQKALIEFQKSIGIKYSLGVFGPFTRGHINSILKQGK